MLDLKDIIASGFSIFCDAFFHEKYFDNIINFEYIFSKARVQVARFMCCRADEIVTRESFTACLPHFLNALVAADRALPENKRCGVEAFLRRALDNIQLGMYWCGIEIAHAHEDRGDHRSLQGFESANIRLCFDSFFYFAIIRAISNGVSKEEPINYLVYFQEFCPLITLRSIWRDKTDDRLETVCTAWSSYTTPSRCSSASESGIHDHKLFQLISDYCSEKSMIEMMKERAEWKVDPTNYNRILSKEKSEKLLKEKAKKLNEIISTPPCTKRAAKKPRL